MITVSCLPIWESIGICRTAPRVSSKKLLQRENLTTFFLLPFFFFRDGNSSVWRFCKFSFYGIGGEFLECFSGKEFLENRIRFHESNQSVSVARSTKVYRKKKKIATKKKRRFFFYSLFFSFSFFSFPFSFLGSLWNFPVSFLWNEKKKKRNEEE